MQKCFKTKYFTVINRLRFTSALLCVVLGLLVYVNASAYTGTKAEYAVKAIYTYRFILFTEWPEKAPSLSAPDTITIGIVGKDPFNNFFAGVENKLIAQKKKDLRIIRLGRHSKKHELKECHLLFISRSEADNLNRILAATQNDPVLTVSDIDNFCDKGGIISLINVGNKIQFEINLSGSRRANLSMAADLLEAAMRVIQ